MAFLVGLPGDLGGVVNSFLSTKDKIQIEATCAAAKVTQSAKDRLFTNCACKSDKTNPLQQRTSVVIAEAQENIEAPGSSEYGQIEFECPYDSHTRPEATLEKIRLKRGYLHQLYLNSRQGAEADLGECAKALLQNSCYIKTLTLDAAIANQLIGRADQTAAVTTLLTLLGKVHQIEFETATPFTLGNVHANLKALDFTKLEGFFMNGIHYWTLSKEN